MAGLRWWRVHLEYNLGTFLYTKTTTTNSFFFRDGTGILPFPKVFYLGWQSSYPWDVEHLPLHTLQQESGTETGNAQVSLGQVLRPQYTFPSCQGKPELIQADLRKGIVREPQYLGYNWDQNMALLLFQLALGSSSIPWCILSAPIFYFLMREMNSPKRLQALSGIWAPENRQNSGRTVTGLQTLYLSYFYWYPLVLIIT